MDCIVINEESMSFLSVVTQILTVIGKKDDERLFLCGGGIEVCKKASDFSISTGHFTRIGVVTISAGTGFRGLVGCMRVIDMNPQEPGCFRPVFQPSQCAINDGPGRAFGWESPDPRACGIALIVQIKTPVKAESPVERKGTDKGCCLISGLFQP